MDNKPREKLRDGMPGRNGGTLRRGGTNKGGPGRPKSAVKEALRAAADERIKLLKELADDKKQDPRVRLEAWEKMAKYGIGTSQEVTGEDGGPIELSIIAKLTDAELDEKIKELEAEC